MNNNIRIQKRHQILNEIKSVQSQAIDKILTLVISLYRIMNTTDKVYYNILI